VEKAPELNQPFQFQRFNRRHFIPYPSTNSFTGRDGVGSGSVFSLERVRKDFRVDAIGATAYTYKCRVEPGETSSDWRNL
jgi:hypothetical protein